MGTRSNNITNYFKTEDVMNKLPDVQTQVAHQIQHMVDDSPDGSYFTEDDIKNIVRQMMDEMFEEKMADIKVMMECVLNERLDSTSRRDAYRNANRNVITYAQFGMENYSYLLMPYLSNLCKSTPDLHVLLQTIVKDLYFNPDCKKNNIVYIPTTSFRTITVYKDGAWKNYELQTTLERVIRRANDVLQHYIIATDPSEENEFKSEIGKKKFDFLVEFTDKIDNLENYPEFREQLLKETEHTIVINQHLVHKHIYEPPPEETTV